MSTDHSVCRFYATSTPAEYVALDRIYPVTRAAIVRRAVLWSIYKKGNK